MNKYVIASGGSGSMSVRALVFALVARYLKPGARMEGKIYIRLVDMDQNSDAKQECEDLIENYNQLRKNANKGPGGGLNLPEIVLESWDFTSAVRRCARKNGVQLDAKHPVTLRKLFETQGPGQVMDAHTDQLMKTFFTNAELDEELDKGFYGHPNIGAMVFNYVRDDFLQTAYEKDGQTVKSTFMDGLMQDIREAVQGRKVPLYLYGSLFGGTGASVTPNLIDVMQSIRDDAASVAVGQERENWGVTRLRIGAAMLMPYYKLPRPSEEEARYALRPDSDKFDAQTKEALKYYDEFHVVDKLDSLLLLGVGRDARGVTSEVYARGGAQKQHFHAVLLAAGAAGVRFLCDDSLGRGLLHWRLNFDAAPNGETGVYQTLRLAEMGLAPEEADLQTMFRFSLLVSQYLPSHFLSDVGEDLNTRLNRMQEVAQTCREQCRPAAGDLAAAVPSPSYNVFFKWKAGLTDTQLEVGYKQPIQESAAFCKAFLNFYYDCAVSGHCWDVPGAQTMADRFTDLLNLGKAAHCAGASNLGAAAADETLWDYCTFDCMDPGRRVQAQFVQNTMGYLYDHEKEKLFAPAGDLDKSFSQVFVACYNAASADQTAPAQANRGGK